MAEKQKADTAATRNVRRYFRSLFRHFHMPRRPPSGERDRRLAHLRTEKEQREVPLPGRTRCREIFPAPAGNCADAMDRRSINPGPCNPPVPKPSAIMSQSRPATRVVAAATLLLALALTPAHA